MKKNANGCMIYVIAQKRAGAEKEIARVAGCTAGLDLQAGWTAGCLARSQLLTAK
jgi:hypothetical protein